MQVALGNGRQADDTAIGADDVAERGLLTRRKVGPAIEYRPAMSEGEYVSLSISQTLAAASIDARQAALARLIGGLDKKELAGLQQLARDMNEKRRKR